MVRVNFILVLVQGVNGNSTADTYILSLNSSELDFSQW